MFIYTGRSRTPPRAKSVDRDSVISESLLGTSPGGGRRGMASSLDSLPDSGMGTLHQSERDLLKERITQLEKQLRVSLQNLLSNELLMFFNLSAVGSMSHLLAFALSLNNKI